MYDDQMGVAPDVNTQIMTSGEYAIVEAQNRAEVDIQIATAKRYPRNIENSLKEAKSLACRNEELAAEMFYKVPRSGKMIEGPSVRLAEIMVYTFGNSRSGARLINIGERELTVQGSFIDLERNNGIVREVRRRITNKEGKQYSDDLINVTANAGAAIAWRNSVYNVIPRLYINQVMEAAKLVALGKSMSVSERAHNMIKAFQQFGITEQDVFFHLAIKDLDFVDLEKLEYMMGVRTALKDGDLAIDDFKTVDIHGVIRETKITSTGKASGIDGVKEAVKEKQAARKVEPAPAQTTEPAPEPAQDAPQAANVAAPTDTPAQPQTRRRTAPVAQKTEPAPILEPLDTEAPPDIENPGADLFD